MDDYPIDIHFARLVEWLDDRAAKLSKEHPSLFESVRSAGPKLSRNITFEILPLKADLQKQRQKVRSLEQEVAQFSKRKISLEMEYERKVEELHIPADCTEDGFFEAIQHSVKDWVHETDSMVRSVLQEPWDNYKSFVKWNCEMLHREQEVATRSTGIFQQPSVIGEVLKCYLEKGNQSNSAFPELHSMLHEWDMATPILLCDTTRNALVHDIRELLCFYKIRSNECSPSHQSAKNPMLQTTILAGSPGIFLNGDADLLNTYVDRIEHALDFLEGSKATHILLLRSSPHYRSRLFGALRTLRERIYQLESNMQRSEQHQRTVVDSVRLSEQRLETLVRETRSLLKSCEQSLRKIYAPREVHIVETGAALNLS